MIGNATILVPDLKAINGCIHIIDTVIKLCKDCVCFLKYQTKNIKYLVHPTLCVLQIYNKQKRDFLWTYMEGGTQDKSGDQNNSIATP